MAFNMNCGIVGLQSVTFGIPEAGTFLVSAKLTLPTIPEGESTNSQVVVTINQNGSTVYTGPAGAKGCGFETTCLANDTIQVLLSSSAAIDQGLNVVRAVISVG